MTYEGIGLFIGLITYHHKIDGKALFSQVIEEKIFKKHKRYLELPEQNDLYKPVAYRMFGNKRLAVLSLIDDYAFANRIFNVGHIEDQMEGFNDPIDFKSVSITGSHTISKQDKPLSELAVETFLKK